VQPHVFDWTATELAKHGARFLEEADEPAYRLKQIGKWLYDRTPDTFSEMKDLPKALRDRLESRFVLHPLKLEREQCSTDGTRKFLWSRGSNGDVESVLIPDRDRVTYCISSQAGCPVKCPFCATGYGGFQGQLGAAEIVDQVVQMRSKSGQPPTNIVFMGMGEPLLNFDAVYRALEIFTDSRQLNVGSRRITVSTVGVPDRIRELQRRFPQIKLAISLHAARDELRDELVPLNRQYPLDRLIGVLRETTRRTGRTVTVEYVILPGVNDSDRDIREIVRLLDGIPARINLIGFNPFAGAPYEKPPVRRLVQFRERLAAHFPGPVTLRRARGADIDGACGQLSLRSP